MKPLLLSLYTSPSFLDGFKDSSQFDLGNLTVREFPDQESYIKYDTDVKKRDLVFIVALDKPNSKFLPLIFASQTARELGARSIGLIVPYLPYMRQDKQFLSGEAVTSKYFAKMLSDNIDWLITIDPHLHRYHSLNEIYKIPTTVLHANDLISTWVQQHVSSPLIIGPDSESEQWVATIAKTLNSPYKILEKIRKGDNIVQIKFPNFSDYQDFTPVLVDDIISTGTTMVETITHLKNIKMKVPICIGVHAIFAHHAYENILAAGAKSVITCNTIEHISNAIDVSSLIKTCLTNIKF
ncbi:ribose-phosphate diphosphokinase [Candidatus Berkiella aquae]|uniref:ribose-phosphate diphosphokinase n=1 Tax=Candidatus Berkiella aquae TaxID=295108 RepID=A0A0Q9YVM6_9GAMM|nr:ribose-phosphate diphosphokinase [Candidatus Berkiella aquae]MCS5711476.1 ribose-phosphate diphosphokinase [Candidatus Berkiella aquae]